VTSVLLLIYSILIERLVSGQLNLSNPKMLIKGSGDLATESNKHSQSNSRIHEQALLLNTTAAIN